jgi:hypothetical protein
VTNANPSGITPGEIVYDLELGDGAEATVAAMNSNRGKKRTLRWHRTGIGLSNDRVLISTELIDCTSI